MFTSAVILAAGKSTRFPTNKLLYEITVEGVKAPLIRHTVSKFIESSVFNEVLVVLGFQSDLVRESLTGLNLRFVINENYELGMSSSVIRGVKAVSSEADVVAIHPGDVPYIKVSTLHALMNYARELLKESDAFVVVPRLAGIGRTGHPLIIGKKLLVGVYQISEKELGLKGFLRRNIDKTHYYDVDDKGILRDIDTLEDLKNV
ncbi:MAG: nucleotidyltransferase family protein [Desulfurococcaceae archaeon TW002]